MKRSASEEPSKTENIEIKTTPKITETKTENTDVKTTPKITETKTEKTDVKTTPKITETKTEKTDVKTPPKITEAKTENIEIKTTPKITFITGNQGKVREVSKMLNENEEGISLPIVNQMIELPELQGDPEDISVQKCKLAAQTIKGPCIVEDTCLCFNALGGMPGPYIKWFIQGCGIEGLNKMLVGFEDKSAYALATFSFTEGLDKPVHTFVGKTNGQIVPPRGTSGFGWDPIFLPDEGNGKTFAELSADEKNEISHRRRGLENLKLYLLKNKNLWE